MYCCFSLSLTMIRQVAGECRRTAGSEVEIDRIGFERRGPGLIAFQIKRP